MCDPHNEFESINMYSIMVHICSRLVLWKITGSIVRLPRFKPGSIIISCLALDKCLYFFETGVFLVA